MLYFRQQSFKNNIFVKNSKHIWLFVLVVSLFTLSCKHEPDDTANPEPPADECDTTLVTYNASVIPILQNNCYSCHSGTVPSAGLDLSNYDQLAFVAQNGSLMGAIKHEPGFTPMPDGLPKLSDCDINTLAKWISDTTFTDPDIGQECDPDTVYFQNEILPLLVSSCGVAGCHDPETAEGGVILTDYTSIMQTADVRPGNPEGSDLYEMITESDPDDRMPPPPNQPLNAEQIARIERWILQGALDNSCENNQCDTLNITFGEHIFPVIQNTCLGCHSGAVQSGGILLTNHSQIAEIAASGRLLGAIKHQNGYSPMPQNGARLNQCIITQFEKWISDGTPNN